MAQALGSNRFSYLGNLFCLNRNVNIIRSIEMRKIRDGLNEIFGIHYYIDSERHERQLNS